MFLKCLSSCDLNLSTVQEDTMRTYLGNLLNILMERHLKAKAVIALIRLLSYSLEQYSSVPGRPMLHVKLHKISLYVLSLRFLNQQVTGAT